ncbi:MAG: hypothetical protein ACOYKF_04670, partial [Phenylobacterium sp.]
MKSRPFLTDAVTAMPSLTSKPDMAGAAADVPGEANGHPEADERAVAAGDTLLEPGVAPAPSPAQQKARKVVGVVLYPGFELLDVFGPVEM